MSEKDDQHPGSSSLPEWGPGQTARGRARLPSSRRRDRPQLSCNLCRERKLRCDRQTPCSNCTKRAVGMACTYLSSVDRPLAGGAKEKEKPPATAQDRIRHLESLLVDLMRNRQQQGRTVGQTPATPRAPEPASLANGLSMLHIPDSAPSPAPSDSSSVYLTEGGETYVINAHWAAVLDDIAELKDHFDEAEQKHLDVHQLAEEPQPPFSGQAGPQLLYGCSRHVTKEEVLTSIPDRSVVDQLVSCYFNSFEMSPAVLHTVQFLEEYEEFWKNPAETPVIWLGLLFTIMCLATQFQKYKLEPTSHTPGKPSPEQSLETISDTFRQRIVHCLILGNYAKGGPYVLQTLMLYIAVELFLKNDAETGVWILLGTVVQLAIQMGYHRDPEHFRGRSPFASEMQRRIWATVVELDLGISAQMGLPRLIRQWQADTMEPSNLQDHDFDKTTIRLPPPRPETDLTPMLFRIVRCRMLTIVGAIWDFATDTRRYTYTDVVNMDERLQNAHSSIPACLKWRSAALCIADTPQAIMQKISLEIMVYRASIVLHRRYLHEPPINLKAHYSRQQCLNAALKLLEYQHILQEKTEPFGQLYHERWKVSSLVNHDFLLATSILCSYLHQVKREVPESMRDGLSTVETIRKALRKSHDIWLLSSSSSREAQKAAKALSIVLGDGSSLNVGETKTPFSLAPTSPASHHDTVTQQQDNLEISFQAFDATVWTGLPNQTSFEPMVPFFGATANTAISPQIIDDTTGSLRWPWDS